MDEQKRLYGFAALSPERRKEVSRLGGKSIPASKRWFSVNRDAAREAGRKGGVVAPKETRSFFTDRELASRASKLGKKKHSGDTV